MNIELESYSFLLVVSLFQVFMMMSSTVLCAVIVTSVLTFSAAQSEYKLCDISTAEKYLTRLFECHRERTRCSMSYNVQCLQFEFSFMFTMLVANYLPEGGTPVRVFTASEYCTVLDWRKIW